MLSEDAQRKYEEAGRIASAVRSDVKTLVKVGVPLIEICDSVENQIKAMGGTVAFPCNVCVNDVAAHYSSPPEDKKTIPEDAVVKIDLGVHVDGYIADTATTVSLNREYDGMVFAVEKALEQAIKRIRPNVSTRVLGSVIQKTIEQYGFKPIWNLTGHQMKKYVLHTGKSIPNVPRFGVSKIRTGEVYAIEPFLTLPSGRGEVLGSHEAHIFRFNKVKSLRSPRSRELLTKIRERFTSLPFSKRWLTGLRSKDVDEAFTELLATKSLSSYPVLVERNEKVVAQAEHTVIVTETGCLVITR